MHDYTLATCKDTQKKCVRNNLKLFAISFGHNKDVTGLSLMQKYAPIVTLKEEDINDL